MKKINLIVLMALVFCCIQQTKAQSIAKSLGMYIFPSNDQDQATQDADEAACYKWAIQQTDYDPLNPPTVTAAEVDTSPDGAAIKGAAVGAAGGAAIGAIAGDAGDGAAIGAIIGGVRGRRAKKAKDAQQQQANNNAAANKSKELEDDYKKAFSVCMEGKGYTIK
ncbi:glycine zipper family protein [uncultured Algibacter sp.]|uniref:glycine zipper family protein n=1 Tax=uncultured Algibacter sp. TaxID=298659 RepID=UPI002622AC76|nr:glycine zipper family protein [uncultured Algibacter sp.]